MNKFTKSIGASDATIKGQRASIMGESAAAEAKALLDSLLKEKREIKTKILNLADLSPETTVALGPNAKEFNAASWIKQMHELELQLILNKVKVKAAKKIQKEWFTEEPEAKIE